MWNQTEESLYYNTVPKINYYHSANNTNSFNYPQNNQIFNDTLPNAQHTNNRFVYINNKIDQQTQKNKILVNPHFKNTVFINPNFNKPHNTTLHINPCVQLENNKPVIHLNPNFQKIYVNPEIVKTTLTNKKPTSPPDRRRSTTVVLTKTKLIRRKVNDQQNSSVVVKKKRRTSIRSKYKIIKSGTSTISNDINRSRAVLVKNRYKIDNRKVQTSIHNRKRHSIVKKQITNKKISKIKTKSQYKFVKKNHASPKKKENEVVADRSVIRKYKLVRSPKSKAVKVKQRKKCNIPCIYYRKYGICNGKSNGKCNRKHDPDQISLCTRFLQGACVKDSCTLSHKVSPEKMPLCKYYLEGSCVKESCRYIHVKLSPKTEICRDFIEGYCKHGIECNKRHQYLCPDYEKYGKCAKQRCQYPHGTVVRKYMLNKHIFVKQCNTKEKLTENIATNRYYVSDGNDINDDNLMVPKRPKLGQLPSFIEF